MTTDLELDSVLAAWLADGAERAPDDDVAAALRQVGRTRQRRGVRVGRRPLSWLAEERWWAAAAVVLVAVVATSTLVGSGSVLPAARSIDVSRFAAAITDPAADEVAFLAQLPADAPETLRWRAATFDSVGLDGWEQSDIATVQVPSGEPLQAAGEEAPPTDLTSPLTVTIETPGTPGNLLLSPGVPVAVDADATVRLIGDHGWFAGADLPSGTTTYTVSARVLRLDDEARMSANQLRAVGQDYPSSVIDRYTAVPPGTLGPDANRLLRAILATTPERDPYDLATAVEAYLKSDRFTYNTDPARCPAAARASSSASRAPGPGTASTTRRRWRSCFGRRSRATRSRPAWSRASCPATASATSRRSGTVRRTPGSRSTSRAMAGCRSIRPGLGSPRRR